MLTKCEKCGTTYDDEFRTTICPHWTFAANDGRNNFAHNTAALISDEEGRCPCGFDATACEPYSGKCLYGS